MRSLLLFICLAATASSWAQTTPPAVAQDRRLIQFSGVVVTGDSLQPVPFTNIIIKHSYRGTMSDVYGYFSFVAQTGDTVLFSAVGFERSYYALPDSLTESKYSMIHVMYSDTVMLKNFDVTPWPSKEQFARAFMDLHLADDDYQIARKNLSPAEMMQRMENVPSDGYASFRNQLEVDNTRLYWSGGYPSINLFNPIAWAQFLQAWQNGAYKKK
ncbi:MAG: carboxypeptidase-like regulatory domain-containing protein [Flavobacteriales bacterium]|nr:carboxypeptidase-like regulatory domain-containing protein [Flavobacteriales bacterium]